MHGFETRGELVPRGRFVDTGRFGRMFPELRSLKEFSPGPVALGGAGGPMSGAGDDNPRIKAGYTFLGQFIDHDLTLDATSSLEQQIDLAATTNFRTPAFELDSLYGRGPAANPALFDRDAQVPGTFLIERDGTDLPRNAQGTAIIGDHRNDENRIIGQLHTLFLKFHNRVLTDVVGKGLRGDAATDFEAAQKIVRWHYQWIVLHEFLPRTVGQEMVTTLLAGIDRNHVGPAYMPVEFSGAAYRFGHSQIRPAYGLGGGRAAVIFPAQPDGPILKPGDPPPVGGLPDLRGGGPLPDLLRIDWSAFFGNGASQSKLIDTKLSPPLLSLPNSVVGVPPKPEQRSLAVRNLIRGFDLKLPAGETIADFLGIERLPPDVLWKDVPQGSGHGPLWFYILREAEHFHQGQHLGGVGAFIVAKTFINLLLADKASFLWQSPKWTPDFVPDPHQPGTFTMADLVNYTLDLQGDVALPAEVIDLGSVTAAQTPTENVATQR